MDNKHWYLDFDNQFWLLGAKMRRKLPAMKIHALNFESLPSLQDNQSCDDQFSS